MSPDIQDIIPNYGDRSSAAAKLRVLSLFAGIGGFDLGLERTGGFETVAFCEINPFCQRVLARHWPEVPCYADVTTLNADTLARDAIGVDVICGGFPCQDISSSGKRVGISGERSGLWKEYFRLICELRPLYVIVENVSDLRARGMGVVLGDLASIGYDAVWESIPACAIGAPHRRDRVWIISYPNGSRQPSRPQRDGQSHEDPADRHSLRLHADRLDYALADTPGARCEAGAGEPRGTLRNQGGSPQRQRRGAPLADAHSQSQERSPVAWDECDPWKFEPPVGRVVDGLPGRVDRVRVLGNAVVPQIPELIGRAILQARAA